MESKTITGQNEVTGRGLDAAGFFRGRTSTVSSVAASEPPAESQQLATAPVVPSLDALPLVPAPAQQPHIPARTVNHARGHAPQQARTGAVFRSIAAAKKSAQRTVAEGVNHVRGHAPQQAQTYNLDQRLTAAKKVIAHENHVRSHVPQRAVTLMRSAVKRPAPSLHQQLKPQASLPEQAVSIPVTVKQSVSHVDSERLARAKSVARSPQVARHITIGSTPAKSVLVPAATPAVSALKPAPAPVVAAKPLTVASSVPPAPAPLATKPKAATKPAPAPKPTDSKPTDSIFEHALANASHFVDTTANKTRFKKQAKLHFISMAAGSLALLVIVGFAVYQSTPGLQFKVASVRAGVATTMPNFKAAGFKFAGVKASEGKLTIGFRSTKGSYQLAQQTTNLSGSEMIQNIGSTDASGNPDYTTVQAGHTTVYRFSNTNATWVAHGTWYVVSGNSAITDSQLKSLVQNS